MNPPEIKTPINSAQETEVNELQVSHDPNSSPFDIYSIIKTLWQYKIFILCFSCVYAICTIVYAINLPNIYRSETLLAPVSSQGVGIGGKSQLGGLASLAGINLSSSSTDKTTLALATLKTRSFLENFIIKHNLLVPLLAAEAWDPKTQTFVYNEEIYDVENNNWLTNKETNQPYKPSLWWAYKGFSNILQVTQDNNTSLIKISIEHYSPEHVRKWLGWLIEDLNQHMRIQDELESKASIKYLTKKIAETKIKNMEMMFYELIEEQSQKLMLTKIKKEYVLKIIEQPQLPEEKVKPKRAMIVLFSSFFGLILSMFLAIFYHYIKNRK